MYKRNTATRNKKGSYLFHIHGFQEENSNKGHILVKEYNKSTIMTKKYSIFDWQMTYRKNYSRNRNDNKNMFLYFSNIFYINNNII